MTGPTPARPQDPAVPRQSGAHEIMPDPWGVRRAENLLTSLEGILSARVITTPLGDVSEIHVLAQAGLVPKQLVRNIESALLAQLGLKVDHRKISIAQTAEVRPIETLEKSAVREQALQRTVLFEECQATPAGRSQRVSVTVSLSHAGRLESATEEVADTAAGRVDGAARAAVTVLDRLLQKHSVALEGVRVVAALERTMVFAVVRGLGGRESQVLTGTAEVRESAERAAVFAVLDATNRWIEARRA
ncbi:MAG: hypothetical protein ABR551_05725 [Gemmatimonadales bacterium]